MRVLIVDDKPENLYLLEALLMGNGHQVQAAANGADALEILQAGGIDLIVSDILMPVMDGFQLCRRVKGDDSLRAIPFIIYTATYTSPKDEAFALKLGADRFLLKPCEPDVFMAVVEEVMTAAMPNSAHAFGEPLQQEEMLKLYNERLVRKLEQKMFQAEQEIQTRLAVEKALRASEEKYRRITENISDVVWIADLDLKTIYVSPSVERLLGEPAEAHLQRTLEERFPGDSLRSIREVLAEELEKEREPDCHKSRSRLIQVQQHRADGSLVWVAINVSFVRDEKGTAVAIQGVIRDISEQRRIEVELRQRERYLSVMLATMQDGFLELDAEGKLTDVNEAYCRMSGYSREEILQLAISDLDADETPADVARRITRIQTDGADRFETRHQRRDGSLFDLEMSATWIASDQKFVCLARDITERKLAQESLRKSEIQYRSIFDNSLDAIFLTVPDGSILEANPAACKMFGWSAEEIRRIGRSGLVDVTDPRLVRVLEERARTGKAHAEITMIRADQSRFPAEITSTVFTVEDGQRRTSMIVRDLSKRKLAEQRIKHLNRILRSIRDVDQLIVRERDPAVLMRECCRLLVDNRGYDSALIVLTDESGLPLSWAASGIASTSESLKALLGGGELPPCFSAECNGEVLLIDDRQGLCRTCPIALNCADTRSLCVELIHERTVLGHFVAALDHRLSVEEEVRSLFAEMAQHLAHALYSLKMESAHSESERKRQSLEAQLHQAQKMESVGRLAGGVAHDFNNMLSVIMGYTEMALARMDSNDPLREYLKEIYTASRRSADLTRQLLAFARKQTIAPRVLDLNDVVEGSLKMLRRLIGEDIDLAWMPGRDLWPINVDPSQIDQILANLCVNARDAIKSAGKIIIETGTRHFDQDYCADYADCVPGDYVLLTVSDDGCGMDEETQEHLFEPFFTTKGVGEGTGLGLATVYGIVKQNNGFVNVYSEPGQGSTFKIYLPRHKAAMEQMTTEDAADSYARGSETVLLVEDERSILTMARKMLEQLGYTVLTANTPSAALRLADDYQGEIHLLVTDLVMPEMNGRVLAERLHAIYPSVKILFMSGYSASTIAHRGVLEEGVHFIQKPFLKKDLAAKMRETLDRSQH